MIMKTRLLSFFSFYLPVRVIVETCVITITYVTIHEIHFEMKNDARLLLANQNNI